MLAAALSAAAAGGAWSAPVETKDLVVGDATGALPADRLKALANQAQATLDRVLAFWSTDSQAARFGKIRVEFAFPHKDGYASVFHWEKSGAGRVRVVRVSGFDETPQMLAHKLTSAVFPQKDKLIRNLMGVLTESRVGNSLTFPLCGLDSDDWVAAFWKTKSLRPFAELGDDHESWGMKFGGGGQVWVFDRTKQHIAYAEAGSLGAYLARAYGVERLKLLQRLSQSKSRPFVEAFGASLDQLEAKWIAALKEGEGARQNNVALATKLFAANPTTACQEARVAAAAGR